MMAPASGKKVHRRSVREYVSIPELNTYQKATIQPKQSPQNRPGKIFGGLKKNSILLFPLGYPNYQWMGIMDLRLGLLC